MEHKAIKTHKFLPKYEYYLYKANLAKRYCTNKQRIDQNLNYKEIMEHSPDLGTPSKVLLVPL